MMNKKRELIFALFLVLLIGCGHYTQSKRFNPPSRKINLNEYLSQEKRPNQNKGLAFAIAISGGGHRAGNFGVGVIAELEKHNILKEIDYISTVSGGGFAGEAYIVTLIHHLEQGKKHEYYRIDDYLNNPSKVGISNTDDSLRRHLERGYVISLIGGLLNPLFWFGNKDRGDLLERKIDNRILGYNLRKKSLLLEDIFRNKEKAECEGEICFKMVPYWVTNATIYENGSIFPFTPDILEEYGIVEYTHRGWKESLGDPNKGKFPVAVGVKASASFPVAIPATTLKSNFEKNEKGTPDVFLHLLDGGLADNLGVYTAISLLEQDTNRKKALLVVDAFKDEDQPFSGSEGSPNSISVAIRSMSIGLDSQHTRLEDSIKSICDKKQIEVVFLNFSLLKSEKLEEIVQDQKQKQLQAQEQVQTDEKEDYDKAKHILYKGARDVKTSFNITRAEQKLLMAAGREVVNLKLDEIQQMISTGKKNR
jgi:predicted acylesterase/phospholipase RssA